MQLRVSISQTPSLYRVVFDGPLDDHSFAVLQTLTIDHPNVALDVRNITYINSRGARDWIKWIATIASHTNYTIERCSPAFISQVNMLSVFAGRGDVTSLFAPVICPQCERQEEVFLEKPFDDQIRKLLAGKCRCGALLEWEEPLEDLLQFSS